MNELTFDKKTGNDKKLFRISVINLKKPLIIKQLKSRFLHKIKMDKWLFHTVES